MSLPEQIIYQKAIEKFWVDSQITICIQELSELIKELTNHLLQRYDRIEDLPGEIADVEITLEQIKIIFNLKLDVASRKRQKIERLEKLL